jgi:hypothetical protein
VVGVNSFKGDGEGLNFAVSADDVRSFLSAEKSVVAAKAKAGRESVVAAACPEPKVIKTWRQATPPAEMALLDVNCDGTASGRITIPDDKTKPILIDLDSTGSGKIDIVLVDENRDSNPEYAVYDSNADGKPDLIGYYRNGEEKPYRFEPYKGN